MDHKKYSGRDFWLEIIFEFFQIFAVSLPGVPWRGAAGAQPPNIGTKFPALEDPNQPPKKKDPNQSTIQIPDIIRNRIITVEETLLG